ncbi:signal peptidase II [Aneurinibacillus sp. Ricciae_BoGa-3]|uniref:signal peptidase II n=1 Tax=Aneurinibacillus sp. Ricciae_BoGa-3 TaxID=3022697 RepID=UPI002341D8FC|nr:signal peptidase II [Aneurinibacillus sp. Ricciae_BoGa-3]WCK52951.1 signal peptidase II [Aneurinibacillus sp. Ricciae_BoGa-3]
MFYGSILLLLILDLVSKSKMETLPLNQAFKVIPGWLSWKLIHNPGASFGILSESTPFLTAVSAVSIFVLFYLYEKNNTKSLLLKVGFAFVISGAAGNFINRIWLGYVIDFIDFRWWPAIFNVADIEIRTGSILLLFLFVLKRDRRHTVGRTG